MKVIQQLRNELLKNKENPDTLELIKNNTYDLLENF